jgi:hypothetical protein
LKEKSAPCVVESQSRSIWFLIARQTTTVALGFQPKAVTLFVISKPSARAKAGGLVDPAEVDAGRPGLEAAGENHLAPKTSGCEAEAKL